MTLGTADVIIIGAGIAGAAAAYELSHDRSVILIEREDQPGYHATGRSAAVTSSTSGLRAVCALAEASRPFLMSPPSGFVDQPLLHDRGLLWVADHDHQHLLAELELAAQQLGVPTDRCTTVESQQLVPWLNEPWAANAVHEPQAMSIDVALLLSSYIAGARAQSTTLISGAEVLGAQRHGTMWTVTTTQGTYAAPVIVNAAGAWGDAVATACGVEPVGLTPMRRSVYVFAIDGVNDWPLVMDIGGSFYFEPEGPGLLVSPAEETHVEPHDAQPDDMAIARSVDTLAEVLGIQVRGVRSRWAGLRTFAPDRQPVVGPDDAAEGYHWLVAQGGAGIKTAPAMAALLRSLLDDDPLPPKLAAFEFIGGDVGVQRIRGH